MSLKNGTHNGINLSQKTIFDRSALSKVEGSLYIHGGFEQKITTDFESGGPEWTSIPKHWKWLPKDIKRLKVYILIPKNLLILFL